MQCIERGILLKTIFDSYVRMVDLIFVDSFSQRKILAQKFAAVFERQVYHQAEQLSQKDKIIEQKNDNVAELKLELEIAKDTEASLLLTNKKLSGIAQRGNAEAVQS